MANSVLDTLSDFIPLLGRIAPALATAIGGPFAGTAVTVLEQAVGVTPGAGPDAIAAALKSATPDQLEKIQKADQDFAVSMRNMDIALDKQDNDDRASARAREMALKDPTPKVLAYVLTVGVFGIITLLLWHGMPANGEQPLNLVLGSIATAWVGMISYYFGSSRGSQAKDLMLYNSVPATSAAGAK